MEFRIIATGGTFDKSYDPIGGHLAFANSHLPQIIETARLSDRVELEIVTLIDSLDMGDEHRMRVLDACRRSAENRIVIIHGTDTLCRTARLIGEARLQKTIVLTGAMVPYSVMQSDALFNLGAAIMAARLTESGTWVAMNGCLFRWNLVHKNRERGLFVAEES